MGETTSRRGRPAPAHTINHIRQGAAYSLNLRFLRHFSQRSRTRILLQ